MTVYVALLRGINVGGHNRLPMADLRTIATACAFANVATYIQSGNVVFTTRLGATKVAAVLHDAILAESGVDSRVVVRTGADLASITANNPFIARDATVDEKLLHVSFLYDESAPTPAAVDAKTYAPDEVAVTGANAYLYTPNGLGRSKMATEAVIRRLGIQGTTRNWRTVTALAEMAAGLS